MKRNGKEARAEEAARELGAPRRRNGNNGLVIRKRNPWKAAGREIATVAAGIALGAFFCAVGGGLWARLKAHWENRGRQKADEEHEHERPSSSSAEAGT